MHLRSISMKGFKSFPSRTKLEFGTGVSVIVGPNGSGKSNITDAVLWALGEQSPLAVRGQSMKDVIFAGAHGVQGSNAAEVEVVIDNGDGALDIDFSEISIVRRLGARRRGRVPPERRALPARGRGRGAVRLGPRQGDALGGLPGQGRADRDVAAARAPPPDRGGRRARQAPQAPPARAAEAGAHRGEPVARARRGARGALAAAAAEAPGRGGRAARAARAPDARGALRAVTRRRAQRAAGSGRGGGAGPQRARRARRGRAPARRGGEAPRAGRGGLRRPDARPRAPAGAPVRSAVGERADRHAPRAGARAGRGGARAARAAVAPGRGARAAVRRRCRHVVRGGAAAGPDRRDRARAGRPRRRARAAPGGRAGGPGAGAGGRARSGFRAGAGGCRAPQRPRGRRAGGGGSPHGAPRRRARRRGRTRPGRRGGRRACGGEPVRARSGGRGQAAGAQPLAERLHVEPGYELALAAVLGPRLTATVVNDRSEGERVLDAAGENGASVLLRARYSGP